MKFRCEAGHAELHVLCPMCDEACNSTEALKAALGMPENGLLTNSTGEMADILDVKDGKVVLAVLSLAKPIIVELTQIIATRPTLELQNPS